MSDYLIIDAGNTQVKWALSLDGQLSPMETVPFPQDVSTTEEWGLSQAAKLVDQAFLGCVAGDTSVQLLIEILQPSLSLPLRVIKVQSKAFGITTCYKNAVHLGIDRWAAMIAARQLTHGAVCVFDCGTATTFDVVDAGGQHLGGSILPGLALMASSLCEGTARIYDAESGSDNGLFACDTVSAVAAGGLQATLGFIERMLRETPKITGTTPTFFICGGNAQTLLPWLSEDIRHEPDLVLNGLNIIAMERL